MYNWDENGTWIAKGVYYSHDGTSWILSDITDLWSNAKPVAGKNICIWSMMKGVILLAGSELHTLVFTTAY